VAKALDLLVREPVVARILGGAAAKAIPHKLRVVDTIEFKRAFRVFRT